MKTQESLVFNKGRVVCHRWKVVCKLGSGKCGNVYKVEDIKRKGYYAALKVEEITEDDYGVLKLEAAILEKLADRKNVVRLLQSGRRAKYRFIAMTICGSDLMTLRIKSQDGFSESTILRVAIFALYAIKQVHEIGFVHRDVKPANMMNGATGRDQRMFFLIDYGMARSFVVRDGRAVSIRRPRTNVLLRGTLRYCSLSVHKRNEQSRADDLWSMLYSLAELYVGLPWNRMKNEEEIAKKKESEPDENVFKECPEEFTTIAKYLRTLTYRDRPDYFKIYNLIMDAIKRENYSFIDKYDWEENLTSPPPSSTPSSTNMETALDYSEREKSSMKSLEGFEKEALIYPSIHKNHFKEVILPI